MYRLPWPGHTHSLGRVTCQQHYACVNLYVYIYIYISLCILKDGACEICGRRLLARLGPYARARRCILICETCGWGLHVHCEAMSPMCVLRYT